MKLLFDFFPILLFFIAFKVYGIYAATVVAIAASFVQVAFYWLKYRRFEKMHIITFALILLLGGATLILHDELFIKWKPTVLNWLFAVVFVASQYIGKKPVIQRMMDSNISLPPSVWKRLNYSWVIFFVLTGAINLYVVYHFDTDTWVNFKLFGILGMTVLFIIGQAIYMTRHMSPEKQPLSKSTISND